VAGAVRIFAARLLAADGRVTLAARDRAARNGREQP